MATDTRTGNVVSNYYNGGYYDWKCQQVVTTSQTNTTVTVTIKINMLGIDSLHFYENDVHSSLYVDGNRVNYVTTSPDKYISPNEAWNRISRTITYTRGTTTASHTIHGNVQVVGGAWEGASTIYNNRLTLTIPTLPSYTISYNANGGTGAPATGKKWYNQTFTVSSTKPTKTGNTFVNWKINETGNYVGAGGTITANSNNNYTLTAQWKLNTYTISYNANGGTGAPSNQTKTYGVNLTLSSTKPTKAGYTFLGWSTNQNATSATYSAGGTYTSNAAATLYAVWRANTYTLAYDANGGNVDPTSKQITYGASYGDLPTPERTNYSFNGWYTAASGGTLVNANTTFTNTANTTIYAQWTLAYIAATITNVVAKRGDGQQESDTGTRAFISFNYNKNNDTNINKYYIKISKQNDDSIYTEINGNISNNNGTINVWSSNNFTISTDDLYNVIVELRENGQTIVSNNNEFISKAFFIMDINANGTAIGFGGAVGDSDKGLYLRDNNDVFRALFDFLYPVGSYYETSDSSFNPNVTWGGTWVKLGEGQVLLSAGNTYSVGTSYGGNSKSYTPAGTVGNTTLTTSQIPAHTHGEESLTGYFNIRRSSNGTTAGNKVTATSGIVSSTTVTASAYADAYSSHNPNQIERVTINATHTHDSVGGNGAHDHGFTGTAASINVMQSSVAVWIWHRTA